MKCIELWVVGSAYEQMKDDFEEVELKKCAVFIDKFRFNVGGKRYVENVILFDKNKKIWLCEKEFNRAVGV